MELPTATKSFYFHTFEEASDEKQKLERLGWKATISGDHMHGFVVSILLIRLLDKKL